MVDNTILRCYNIYPNEKDTIYTIEHWSNTLSNGKPVTILHTQYWRDGTFSNEMTDEDKEKLEVQTDVIILNNIGASVEELEDGWYYGTEIKNKDKYNDDELREIRQLMYCRDNNDEYNDDDDNVFETDIMEINEWILDDTIYELYDGCELELTSD
tara:strand:+ start:37 stop:504 length:468 start_codon:yes stop_codon:yes gene_type:complete